MCGHGAIALIYISQNNTDDHNAECAYTDASIDGTIRFSSLNEKMLHICDAKMCGEYLA